MPKKPRLTLQEHGALAYELMQAQEILLGTYILMGRRYGSSSNVSKKAGQTLRVFEQLLSDLDDKYFELPGSKLPSPYYPGSVPSPADGPKI